MIGWMAPIAWSLVAEAAIAGASLAESAEIPRSEAVMIREQWIEARLRSIADADASGHFELAEELAELLRSFGRSPHPVEAPLAARARALVGELCGWAIREDPALAPRSLRLMLELEPDSSRRQRLRRVLRLEGGERGRFGDASDRGEVVRRLAAIHRGDPRAFDEARSSPLLGEWLDEHPDAATAELQERLSMARGTPRALEPAMASRLFEIEWAWLSQRRAGFAGSLRTGGRRPLAEIDREELSEWLGASPLGRSWRSADAAVEPVPAPK
jgi:hypothetical protein